MPQEQFKADQSWHALEQLLGLRLDGIDVASTSQRDFNERGEIIMTPPSVRILYTGEKATSLSDTQRLSYDIVGGFLVMCADEDRTDAISQAKASLLLVGTVKNILAGTRLARADGDVSDPITYVGMEMIPVEGLGIAYCVAVEVPGLAQFEGQDAQPAGGDD